MISRRYRCLACNGAFVETPGKCPNCKATSEWEPCVVDDTPIEIKTQKGQMLDRRGKIIEVDIPVGNDPHLHGSGVRFFAYEEAAKAGAQIPDWAAPHVPAEHTERLTLDQRIAREVAKQVAEAVRNAEKA